MTQCLKIISHDISREKAINKLKYALSKIVLLGPITNIELLKNILSSDSFVKGEYNTNFIFENKKAIQIVRDKSIIENIAIAATLHRWSKRNRKKKLLKHLPSGWRNNFYQSQTEKFYFNGNEIRCNYKIINRQFVLSFGKSNYSALSLKQVITIILK